MNVRALAARALAPVLQDKGALRLDALEAKAGNDSALLSELCYGSLRQYPRLKLILEELLDKPLKERDSDITALLTIGLYQLFHMRIPDHAALNETVSATQTLKKKWARGLVNAVLRNAQRQQEQLDAKLSDNLEYRSAHPKWLAATITTAWPDQAEAIFAAGNDRPPMVLRVNPRLNSSDEYLKELESEGVEATLLESSDAGLRLTIPCPVSRLTGFRRGTCSVQDEAAQWVAPMLQVEKNQRVLDACAAPGGKTCHILERYPEIDLTAIDIDERRVESIAESLQRLKLDANLLCVDAADPKSWWDNKPFDRILVDAPCSGTGVIRRHPDIKLLRRPSDIDQFVEQQQRLLKALWPLLAPDGLLLYVTCSIMPAENEEQIQRFLAEQLDAEIELIRANPAIDKQTLRLDNGLQSLPARDGADGFYFALLRKSASAPS